MEIRFQNLEYKKELILNSDKSFIIIYGKNGSGKTTFSRSSDLDNKFVFNEDFIYSNIYNIGVEGASQTSTTKENISGLWLGHDIVKIRKEISDLILLNKRVKEEFQKEQSELLNILNSYHLSCDINDKLKKLFDNTFSINIEEYDSYKESYVSVYEFPTIIKNDDDFKEKQIYYDNNNVYNILFSKIKNNHLLSELIFNDGSSQINLINEKIDLLKDNERAIKEIETVFKKGNIDSDLKIKIQQWYKLHLNRSECVFCGNNNIDKAMKKWHDVFNNDNIEVKTELLKKLESNLEFFNNLLDDNELMNVDEDIKKLIKYLSDYMKKYIEDVNSNVFNYFEFKYKKIKKEIVELNTLLENLVNYELNKRKNIFGFYYNSLKYIENVKKQKLMITDKLMDRNGPAIANRINDTFKKIGLEKNIIISVDKYSSPHKFTYNIKNHSNISELSDGQKHKLALAIFMNYLSDNDLSGKTIVIDDPVVSMDIAGYILFKSYLINHLIKNYFKKDTRLVLLTHDITYLYIQLSNIFDDNDLKNETSIFKLDGKKLEEIPIDFIKTDDITLFRDALDNLTNLTELRILNSIVHKIFRMEIDLKLRFFGMSNTKDIGVDSLLIDNKFKSELSKYEKFIMVTSRRNNPSDNDIVKSIQYLKISSDILGFTDFVTNEHLDNIKKIVENNISGEIEYDLFNVIKSVSEFLKSNKNDDFKHYIEHPRNSYTRNIIGLGLDDYYN